jgi:hypothetical protein
MTDRTDISPMVERVARALAVANGGQNNGDDLEAYGMAPHHAQARWLWHVNDARVAIEAMREPFSAMTEAGIEHTGDPCWEEDVAKAWRAMVDIASGAPSPTGQISPQSKPSQE